MDQETLRSHLQQLDRELRAADQIDPRNRELVQRLAADIGPILAGKKAAPEHYRGLRDRLTAAAAGLETEYPRVTTAIENVIEALVRLNL